jgi:SOS regulatory protein LexA
MREIADAVGLKSTSAVSYQLKILEQMGQLTRDARMPRTVVQKPPRPRPLPDRPDEAGEAPAGTGSPAMVRVPLVEQIAAGTPVIANPDPEGIMHLPQEMTGSGALFAVKVAGDSMANANIFDGDCVIVRQQDTAHNGDIVAALTGDKATVKTFHRGRSRLADSAKPWLSVDPARPVRPDGEGRSHGPPDLNRCHRRPQPQSSPVARAWHGSRATPTNDHLGVN